MADKHHGHMERHRQNDWDSVHMTRGSTSIGFRLVKRGRCSSFVLGAVSGFPLRNGTAGSTSWKRGALIPLWTLSQQSFSRANGEEPWSRTIVGRRAAGLSKVAS